MATIKYNGVDSLTYFLSKIKSWASGKINGLIYDVSALHPTSGVSGGSTYASLSAALAVIPQDKRKGGMTVKFVQSSDNKYVQYFLNNKDWSTIPAYWQKVNLEDELNQLYQEVNGLKYEGAFNITSTGDHSSNNDIVYFQPAIPAGEYTFKVESGTTGNSGYAVFYVKYVGAGSTTSIGSGALGTVITAELANPIESIGIYMSAATNQHTGSMPLTIESTADNIVKDIQQLQSEMASVEQKTEENEGDISQLDKKILDLRYLVGEDTSIVLNKLDYSGMIYSNGNIIAASALYNAFMLRVQGGIEYDISPSASSVRFSSSPFSIGGNTGLGVTFPYTPVLDGYLLITVNTSSDEYTLSKGVSGLVLKVGEVEKAAERAEISVDNNYSNQQSVNANNILTRGISLPFTGKAKVTMNVVSGVDTGKWRIYRNQNGTIGTLLVNDTDFGVYKDIEIPSTDIGVWLFTTTSISSARTYEVVFKDMPWSVRASLEDTQKEVSNIRDAVGTSWYPELITKNSGRVSMPLNIGHGDTSAQMIVSVISGTDNGKWRLYGTNNEGTSIDVNTIITNWTNFGNIADFTVPSNGYVWLFTEDLTLTSLRTYAVNVKSKDCILVRLDELQPLAGKTIVCFGDSITEFGYNGKRYSDWLAEMSGATVINVGVGGTQLRQRTTPSLTPSGDTQCYAGLDIVNMVKSACTQDFAVARASAAELARISADDNREIVERLAAIDWTKVDYVTIFAGTNDWANNSGNTGDKTTTDVGYTCGAINDIINRICSTYKKVQLYWFTPIIRCVNAPNFSSTTSYDVDDMCSYQGGFYKFINAHLGEWDTNDVESITRVDFRIPEYCSDNWEYNGKNLREFSAIIEEVVLNNHIPVCDLYNRLGWNLYNFSEFFLDSDNTHPYKGFKQIAEKINKFIVSN